MYLPSFVDAAAVQIAYDIADRIHLLELLHRNIQGVFILQIHGQFIEIQGIRSEIIPEIGVLSSQNNYADKYWTRYNREGSTYKDSTSRFDEDDGQSFWDFFYRPGSEDHVLVPFITFDKPISQTELNSYAASRFPEPSLETLFEKDLQKVRDDAAKVSDDTLKVYRLEIIRKNCQVEVYINGEKMAEFDDMIRTTVEDKGEIPQSVAISYGPVLINGGKTVTCSIGNLAIYSNK